MKTLIFNDKTSIPFVECYAAPEYVQGTQRDVLDFRFDPTQITLDEVDKLFTTEKCTKLTIEEETTITIPGEEVVQEDGTTTTTEPQTDTTTNSFIYENYSIRVSLSKQVYSLFVDNQNKDVEQISIKLGSMTPSEVLIAEQNNLINQKLTALSDQNDFQEELIVELANIVYA